MYPQRVFLKYYVFIFALRPQNPQPAGFNGDGGRALNREYVDKPCTCGTTLLE